MQAQLHHTEADPKELSLLLLGVGFEIAATASRPHVQKADQKEQSLLLLGVGFEIWYHFQAQPESMRRSKLPIVHHSHQNDSKTSSRLSITVSF